MGILWLQRGKRSCASYDIRGQEVPADKFTKSFRHSQKFKSGGTKCTIRRIAAV